MANGNTIQDIKEFFNNNKEMPEAANNATIFLAMGIMYRQLTRVTDKVFGNEEKKIPGHEDRIDKMEGLVKSVEKIFKYVMYLVVAPILIAITSGVGVAVYNFLASLKPPL